MTPTAPDRMHSEYWAGTHSLRLKASLYSEIIAAEGDERVVRQVANTDERGFPRKDMAQEGALMGGLIFEKIMMPCYVPLRTGVANACAGACGPDRVDRG
jgi:hypothetical protein